MAQDKRELDVTEMIRGLKAVQREARKATQALRELGAAETSAWTFSVNDIIECRGPRNTFRCICADRETAVFAPTSRTDDGWHTEYIDMWACPITSELRDSIAGEYRMITNLFDQIDTNQDVSAFHGGNLNVS